MMKFSSPTEMLIDVLHLKKYSEQTIRSYAYHLELFLKFKSERHYTYLSSQDVKDYLIEINDRSESFVNQAINSIRCLFDYILNRKLKNYMVIRPKKAKTCPILLSDDELKAIFRSCHNKKHLAIMYLLYGSGLRVSEVINLKIEHIDRNNNLIQIRSGKGRKDRSVMLDAVVITGIDDYIEEYNPTEYLFNGQNGRLKYSVSSIQQFVRAYAVKANVNKRVHPHLFRHNFATGVLENGGGIYDLQVLLGHGSPTTTSNVYAHLSPKYIASIKSPISTVQFQL